MRRFWAQLHWLLGITAGVVLAVVGVTGGLLSFEDELLRAFNPGAMTVVAPAEAQALPPAMLIERIGEARPDQRVVSISLSTERSHAVRIGLAARTATPERGADGRPRTSFHYVDPYTGELLPPPRGQEFFRAVTNVHRRLAAEEPGKQIVGGSTVALIVLSLSGLYLRWPRRPLDWRNWLALDLKQKARSFLWHLHAVVGTWVLLLYLLAGITGLYWSYEWYRNGLFTLTGAPRPTRDVPSLAMPARGDADLAMVWASFLRESGGYSTATVTLPMWADQPVDVRYLDTEPAHDRASNRLLLDPSSGAVVRHERYADKKAGAKIMSSMLALHSGSYFGVIGAVLMMLASLAMPLFAVTGWILYLGRRRIEHRFRSPMRLSRQR